MSYTPTNWSAGDTVTSAKLNKMEQGIANAGGANILVAHCGDISSNITLDVTLKQIVDADFTIIQVNSEDGRRYAFINQIYSYEDYFVIELNNGLSFIAQSEDDYPIINTGSSGNDVTPT